MYIVQTEEEKKTKLQNFEIKKKRTNERKNPNNKWENFERFPILFPSFIQNALFTFKLLK